MLPELAIVVPVLNEEAALPQLFRMLARQQGVAFHLILCDGGSTDGTIEVARVLCEEAPFAATVLRGEPGRGRQMNAGAAASAAECILFLHADSDFDDEMALRKGIDALRRSGSPGEAVAGRFCLRFDRAPRSFGWSHMEAKARLNRRGCIHGDQGFLLHRDLFTVCGGFAEGLPVLEDLLLAEAIMQKGRWILLPAEIRTSPRRFETEGLAERRTVNAMLVALAGAGRLEMLREVPQLYRRQGKLDVAAVAQGIDRRMDALPLRERLRFWYGIGEVVAGNAWQPAFAAAAWRAYCRNVPVRASAPDGSKKPPGVTLSILGALLTYAWFRALPFFLKLVR